MSRFLKTAALTTFAIGTAAAGTGVLLVANKGDHTMGIIDPATNKQIATVEENGITAHELIASPDGKIAYVPIYGDSGVGKPGTNGSNMLAIDVASRKVIGNVDFGHGNRPHCAQIGPKNNLLIRIDRTGQHDQHHRSKDYENYRNGANGGERIAHVRD